MSSPIDVAKFNKMHEDYEKRQAEQQIKDALDIIWKYLGVDGLRLTYRCVTEFGTGFDIMFEDDENYYLLYNDRFSTLHLAYGTKEADVLYRRGAPGKEFVQKTYRGWHKIVFSGETVDEYDAISADPWACPPEIVV